MKITKKDALALLDTVVAKKGVDTTALACKYFEPDGSPSCIVGHVLAELGKTERDLSGDGKNLARPNVSSFDTLVVDGVEFTEKAAHVLNTAQKVQDGRYEGPYGGPDITDRTWGKANKVAKKVAKKL